LAQTKHQKDIISQVKLWLKLFRVKQWTKNGLLFMGIIFTRQLHVVPLLLKVLAGFGVFCLLSSTLYIFNDIMDIEKDRNHPRKQFRPLASGALPVPAAAAVAALLGTMALIAAYLLGWEFFLAAIAYAGMTLAYSLYLKRIALIDVMTIAAGFVLRAVAGALVISVPISPWLLVCTLLLALFLALTKRRQELQQNGNSGTRRVLETYTVAFLDQAITIVTAATLTGYFLYTFTAHTQWLMLTIPFVLYGIFRYLLLAHGQGMGEEPEEVLLRDGPFIANIILWLIACSIIMYLG
jgi:4-hydroxybenzoate polyprenyltransferase